MLGRATMLVAVGIGSACGFAGEVGAHPPRHGERPHAFAYGRPHAFTYKLNPYAEYRWWGPGFSFGLGDWGTRPSFYPYADIWTRAGRADDLACNMPSSPCWNEDRE
jgi:hypothetical protein